VVEAALSPARRRRGLLAVWAVLGLLVALIAGLELADRRHARPAAEADARRLLPVPVAALGAVEIADRGRLHRFERDASGGWFYHGVHAAGASAHTHAPDPALTARIDGALAALGRARIERQFALDRDAAAYGLAPPEIVLLLYRPGEGQPLAQYAVGGVAPDTASRYVMRVGSPTVLTIANYQIENLQSLVTAAASPPPASADRR
jgi:Domain of unknown function (DUF4340)